MDADRLSGGLLFALGLVTAREAWRLPFGTVHAPDSGFFPLCLALTLLVSSGAVILGTFRKRRVPAPLPAATGLGRVLVAVAALGLYVAVLDRVGYLPATFSIMALWLGGLERLGWRVTLGIAVPAVIVSYVVFRWLGVPLPQGIVPL